jgi:hypothetical protein
MKRFLAIVTVIAAIGTMAACGTKSAEQPRNEDSFEITDGMFTYIGDDGSLRLRSVNSGVEKVILSDETFFEYHVNLRKGLVAYIADDADGRRAIIYHMNSKTKEVLEHPGLARDTDLTPDGKYLILETGTSAIGTVMIYDLSTKAWRRTFQRAFCYNLSPDGSRLALAISQVVDPPLFIEDGSSASTVVMNFDFTAPDKIVFRGDSSYLAMPLMWIDNDELIVAKYFLQGMPREYFLASLLHDSIEEIEEDALPLFGFPEDVIAGLYDISKDQSKALYSVANEDSGKSKIMLWDKKHGSKVEICIGSNPKWVADSNIQ